MKRATAFAAMLFMAGSAQAEDITIVHACEKVAGFQFNVSDAAASDVQAFPELDPPRVRMRVLSNEAAGTDDLVAALLSRERSGQREPRDFGMVFCEFQSASAPFNLTAFDCAGVSCFISNSRLEELQALMRREGY